MTDVSDQPHPRRRLSDRDRRRWNDERLDDRHDTIDRRLDNIEHFVRAFSQVPGLMQGVKEQIEDQQEDLRDLRKRIDSRFDKADGAHQRVEQKADQIVKQTSTNWKEFFTYLLAAATGVGMPIIGYLIATH